MHGAVLRAQQAVSFSTVGGLRLIKCRRTSNAVERPGWNTMEGVRSGEEGTGNNEEKKISRRLKGRGTIAID